MNEAESFVPLGLSLSSSIPTAYAVGCSLAPLRAFPVFLEYIRNGEVGHSQATARE